MSGSPTYAVLSGGVGGAKLALGLQRVLEPAQLKIIANTGDDFEHLGLHICPDIDTLLYTMAGTADPDRGWGLADETWQLMDQLEKLGGPAWFRLGDRDLATHLLRTQWLSAGKSLSEVCCELRVSMGVLPEIWPMSDQPVRTRIVTDAGTLDFQDYFVRKQAQPAMRAVRYEGCEKAAAAPAALGALTDPALAAVIITPSNPWLSIDPILSLSDIKSTINNTNVPVIGVSPIVGGKAIKGPTAKLMAEIGIKPSALSIAQHYAGLLDGLVIDEQDAGLQGAIEETGLTVTISKTIMRNTQDKIALAETAVAFAGRLAEARNS